MRQLVTAGGGGEGSTLILARARTVRLFLASAVAVFVVRDAASDPTRTVKRNVLAVRTLSVPMALHGVLPRTLKPGAEATRQAARQRVADTDIQGGVLGDVPHTQSERHGGSGVHQPRGGLLVQR